jgi:SAM-dependent methyltransferase
MSAENYYEAYWDSEANAAAGWTPSEGIVTREERALFDRWLPAGTTCLDYGCGDGLRYGGMLRERGIDYRGFDVSAAAIEQARKRGLNVAALEPTGKISLPDASVDAAICFEVLEHLQEPQQALAEILRCLKPGGHALLSVPNSAFWVQRLEFLVTGFWCPGGSPITARKEPWRDPHIRFYHRRTLRQLVGNTGFATAVEFGEAFTLGALPFVWRKPGLRALADALSRPVGWLGRVLPSWFAARLFLVARKPAPQS